MLDNTQAHLLAKYKQTKYTLSQLSLYKRLDAAQAHTFYSLCLLTQQCTLKSSHNTVNTEHDIPNNFRGLTSVKTCSRLHKIVRLRVIFACTIWGMACQSGLAALMVQSVSLRCNGFVMRYAQLYTRMYHSFHLNSPFAWGFCGMSNQHRRIWPNLHIAQAECSLLSQDQSDHDPRKRMRRLFESLYACLVRGGRAVLQIYPENAQQVDCFHQCRLLLIQHTLFCETSYFVQAEMLTSTAMKSGFSGGLVVDFPHSTRAKKYFLVLMVGSSSYQPQAKGVNGEDSGEEDQVTVQQRSQKRRKTHSGTVQVRHFLELLINLSFYQVANAQN